MDIQAVYRALIGGFRRRRMRRFEREFRPGAGTRILDVGGTRFNWELVRAQPRVTLLNLAAPERADDWPARFAPLVASGTRLPHPDGAFDVAFCNSVIEHLGSADAQRALAAELRRVARGVWVQTPARGFFFETHLLTPIVHWLPRGWQRRLLRNFTVWGWLVRPDRAQVERFLADTRLLDADGFAALFPDCEIRRERWLGMTKAYVAVRRPDADVAA